MNFQAKLRFGISFTMGMVVFGSYASAFTGPPGDPCRDIPGPTAEEVASEISPWLKTKIFEIHRPLAFWRYGYRTPKYPQGAPAGEYDLSTPILSQNGDYVGPADERFHADDFFKLLSGGARFSKINYGNFNGLYTAGDPLSSLDFFNGSLMKIEVPVGTKFISLRNEAESSTFSLSFAMKLICEKNRRLYGPETAWRKDILREVSDELVQVKSDTNVSFVTIQLGQAGRDGIQMFYDKFGVAGISSAWRNSPYSECNREGTLSESSRTFIFTNPNAKVTTHLLVERLEEHPSSEKRKLYREALDYFEAFDFSECSKTHANICPEPGSNYVQKAIPAFWKIYRGWATSIYGIDENLSQSDLEYIRQQQFENMKAEKRKSLLTSTFGCESADLNFWF